MFGMTRRKHFAGRRIFENPLARLVAPAPEIRRIADPVVVHIDTQRGRRRVLRE